jgi:hypothetical protein
MNTRCMSPVSIVASSSQAESGRRSHSPVPTFGTPRCSFSTSRQRRSTRASNTTYLLRFSHLVRGKMAVIISYRFSTVRMADRIIVLQHGTVVEDGTHEALVAQGGLYATLFALQAEGNR